MLCSVYTTIACEYCDPGFCTLVRYKNKMAAYEKYQQVEQTSILQQMNFILEMAHLHSLRGTLIPPAF